MTTISSTREQIALGPITIRFLIDGTTTGESMSVFEFDVAAGAGLPESHSHDAFEEMIYGLAGVTTWTVDGEPTDVGPGEALLIPRGAVHRFANTRDVDATALSVITPGILGPSYFRDIAAVLASAAGGPPDFAAIGEIMRRHGLTPVV